MMAWFGVSFFFSPLAAAIIIALLPNPKAERAAELRHLELLDALSRAAASGAIYARGGQPR